MKEMLNELKTSYNEYLKKIPNGCDKIVELIWAGDIQLACQYILQLVGGIEWLYEANLKLKIEDDSVVFNIETINQYLNEINNGLERQDYVLVTDVFEYEIKPFFNNLQQYNLN